MRCLLEGHPGTIRPDHSRSSFLLWGFIESAVYLSLELEWNTGPTQEARL